MAIKPNHAVLHTIFITLLVQINLTSNFFASLHLPLTACGKKTPFKWPEAFFVFFGKHKAKLLYLDLFLIWLRDEIICYLFIQEQQIKKLLTWHTNEEECFDAKMSDINLALSLRDIILCRCVFTVWLDVLFPSQVGILASANTSCIRAHVTSVLNLPCFYLKKNGIMLSHGIV